MKTILIMAMKDLRLLWRDRFGLFWVIGFPFAIALLFGTVFSGGGGGASEIDIAVVDEDSSASSIEFISELEKSEAFKIYPMERDSAYEQVRKGKLVASIVIEEGFGQSGGFMFGGETPVEVGIDPSRKAESGYLKGILTQALFSQMFGKYSNPDSALQTIKREKRMLVDGSGLESEQNKLLGKLFDDLSYFMENVDANVYSTGMSMESMDFKTKELFISNKGRPRSAFEVTFPSAILWALIGVSAAFGVSIVQERTRGTYLRLRLAPVRRFQILGGKGVACFMASIGVSIALIVSGHFVFGVRIGSLSMLALALICSALCFVGIMMLISVLGKTEQAVGGAGWAILLVLAMIGGGMIPVMFMPKWLFTAGSISPVRWGIIALEGAIWRDYSLTEMLTPIIILLGIGALCFTVGVTILRRYDG
ncbi:MAG: ABC transporter permease subunit [candidate division Zixibacteria bacterium]|nr:ABC transporter permease subunit [candidate division Zixibacteria bacterium]